MKLIGIEEHFLMAEVRDAWNAIGLASIDPSVAIHRRISGEPARQDCSHTVWKNFKPCKLLLT